MRCSQTYKYEPFCHQYIQSFWNGAQILRDMCIYITDVFPPYSLYTTTFDALLVHLCLCRPHELQLVDKWVTHPFILKIQTVPTSPYRCRTVGVELQVLGEGCMV